ncbi:hypothetical protein [Kocuria rhizophila]|uniref:hypothetical protein n=1 Tax=Kocuria rhizophila TaxID=72000 RepID=UPI003D6F75E5
MTETINDFETALDTWDVVTDANNRMWIRDENECARGHVGGGAWGRPTGVFQPAPPFTKAHAEEGTA